MSIYKSDRLLKRTGAKTHLQKMHLCKNAPLKKCRYVSAQVRFYRCVFAQVHFSSHPVQIMFSIDDGNWQLRKHEKNAS